MKMTFSEIKYWLYGTVNPTYYNMNVSNDETFIFIMQYENETVCVPITISNI